MYMRVVFVLHTPGLRRAGQQLDRLMEAYARQWRVQIRPAASWTDAVCNYLSGWELTEAARLVAPGDSELASVRL